MRFKLLLPAILLSASFAAHADTISNSYNTGAFVTPGGLSNPFGDTTLSVAGFNSSLGTLNSITLTLTGQYTASGTSQTGFDDAIFKICDSTNVTSGTCDVSFTQTKLSAGTYSVSSTFTGLDPFFVSASNISPVFGFREASRGVTDTNATSDGLELTVVYNYTPNAAATPEASSFVLLGSGLLGIAGVMRKRLA
jgi:hypothetical protein